MNRKKFIKAYKEGIKTDFQGKIIIVGAGITGVMLAHFLYKSNINFEILEASSTYGGRIRALQNFSDFPIELGAEEIHGKRSSWCDLIKDFTNAEFFDRSHEQDDYTFYAEKLLSERGLNRNREYRNVRHFLAYLDDYDEEDDKTILQILRETDIPTDFYPLINAWSANEYGASIDRIGARSRADLFQNWNSGDQNFVLEKNSYFELIQKILPSVLPKIKLNTCIKTIDSSTDKILLCDQNEKQYIADKVFVTVPLTVLKSKDITFVPELPLNKRKAIDTVGMGAGMKIILKFTKHFWEEHTGSIYGQGYIPEFYTTAHQKSNDAILTAFVMGENAEYLSNLGEHAVGVALQELDQMFGDNIPTQHFEKAYIMDWLKEPFIKGAYSYPSPFSEEARHDLAESINQKLYFAGEACNLRGHAGTVHGAIETAYISLIEALK